MTDMSLESVHNATLTKLYAALQSAIMKEQADLISVLSSAIQRLTR
jgi:hypothetical protein